MGLYKNKYYTIIYYIYKTKGGKMNNYTVEMKLVKILTPQEIEKQIAEGTFTGDNRVYDMVVKQDDKIFSLEPSRSASTFLNQDNAQEFISYVAQRKGADIEKISNVAFVEISDGAKKTTSSYQFSNSAEVDTLMTQPTSINEETMNKYSSYKETYTPREVFDRRIEKYRERRENLSIKKDLAEGNTDSFTSAHHAVAFNEYEKQMTKALKLNYIKNDLAFTQEVMAEILENNTQVSGVSVIKIPKESYNPDSTNMMLYLKHPVQYELLMSECKNHSESTKEIHLPRDFVSNTKNYESMNSFANHSHMTTGEYIKHYQEVGDVNSSSLDFKGGGKQSYGQATPIYSAESCIQEAFDIAYKQMHDTHQKELMEASPENQDLIASKHKFESALYDYQKENFLKPADEKASMEPLHKLYVDFQEQNLGRQYHDYTASVKKPTVSVNVAQQFQTTSTKDTPTLTVQESPSVKPLQLGKDQYEGYVKDFGTAPYQNDPKNKDSFYLTLEKNGETATRWGVDIEQKVANNDIQKGDYIELQKTATQAVGVKNDQGELISGAVKNEWQVDFKQPEDTPERNLRQGKFHYEGTVKEIGVAPYKGGEPQPFITLENNGRTITQWGKGAEDILKSTDIKEGDYIDIQKGTDSTKSYNEWKATKLPSPKLSEEVSNNKSSTISNIKAIREGGKKNKHEEWFERIQKEEKKIQATSNQEPESTNTNTVSVKKNDAVLRMKYLRNN